jgi:hypothetical protein
MTQRCHTYDAHARDDFAQLPPEQQVAAIRSWGREGCSDHEIAARTRLHVEQVRRLLALQPDDAASMHSAAWSKRNAP